MERSLNRTPLLVGRQLRSSGAMANYYADIAEMSEDELRAELGSLRVREELWEELWERFSRMDGGTHVLLSILERWVLLNQFTETDFHRKKESQYMKNLQNEVDRFDAECGTVSNITVEMRSRFDLKITNLAQNWTLLAREHPQSDFSTTESIWARKRTSRAVALLWESALQQPDLSSARNARAARTEALQKALMAASSDDKTGRPTPVPKKWPHSPSENMQVPGRSPMQKRARPTAHAPECKDADMGTNHLDAVIRDCKEAGSRFHGTTSTAVYRASTAGMGSGDLADIPVRPCGQPPSLIFG